MSYNAPNLIYKIIILKSVFEKILKLKKNYSSNTTLYYNVLNFNKPLQNYKYE